MLRLSLIHPLMLAMALSAAAPGWASPLRHTGEPQHLDQRVARPVNAQAEVLQGLRLILPENWQVEVAASAKLPDTLSWAKTDAWPSVLQRLSDSTGLTIHVDWTAHRVRIEDEGVARSTTAGRPGAGAAWERVEAQPRAWAASPNSSLHTTLTGWAEQSGWTLHWDLPADLELLAGFEHNGDFEDAVRSLLKGIHQAGGAEIRAGFYAGNRVLRIHAPTP